MIFWQKARSSGGTLLLAGLLVGYLAVGRFSGMALQPRVMIVLAAMTIAHGGWVIANRCRNLVPGSPAASRDRPDRLVSLLDIAMLAGLLAALSLGLANYLLGFQGYLEIIPGGETMQLGPNLQLVDQGALSQPRAFTQDVRGTEFVMGSAGQDALRLQLRTGSRVEELLLLEGRPQYHKGLRLAYQGDGYRVMLSVQRGSHDYLAAPLILRPLPGSKQYGARLDVTEPGASGEVTMDPGNGAMFAVVRRNGVKEFAGTLQPGEVVRGGEMRLQVTSSSHFGRVMVQHRNYRRQTLAAIALFLAAGVGRLGLRKKSPAATARQ